MKKCPICEKKKISTAYFGKSVVSGYVCETVKESLNQKKYKVKINFCKVCGALFQDRIDWAEKKADIIYKKHEATIRTSKSYKKHYLGFARKILNLVAKVKHPKIVEIGCNDGSLLRSINKLNPKNLLFGFEPSRMATEWNQPPNYKLVNCFLNIKTAKCFVKQHGTADVVFARHVLEHIAKPHEFVKALAILCKKSGAIVIESPYVLTILKNFRYDNVSYTHAIHYSLKAIRWLFFRYQFKVVSFEKIPIDGGSALYVLKKQNNEGKVRTCVKNEERFANKYFYKFKSKFRSLKEKLNLSLKKQKRLFKIVGFGAGAKGIFLIHIFKLNKLIKYVHDNTYNYDNKIIPGTNIEIKNKSSKEITKNFLILNLAPTHTEVIRKKCPGAGMFLDIIQSFPKK